MMMRYRLHELLRQQKRQTFHKAQVIQSTEQPKDFFLVTKGYVKRYLISNSGTLHTEVIYGPGDVFPLTLAFSELFGKNINDSPEIYYYEAITPVEIRSMPMEELAKYINVDPLIYKSLFLESGTRLHSTLNGLENLALRDSYKRVAHMLIYLAGRFGQKTDAGIKIMVPITHQDLADMLSLTRETVSKSMSELKQKGLIESHKQVFIPSLKKLKEEAYK